MKVSAVIKNYRCFDEAHPARFEIGSGITTFIGLNNSGKSSLVKFLYEIRPYINHILNQNQLLIALRSGSGGGNAANFLLPSGGDEANVFTKGNSHDLIVDLDFSDLEPSQDIPIATGFRLTIHRLDRRWRIAFKIEDEYKEVPPNTDVGIDGAKQLLFLSVPVASLAPLLDALRELENSMYLGPFRNALNLGANEAYFDIRVGRAFIDDWRRYATGPSTRDNEAAEELQDNIRKIFGFDRFKVSPSADGDTLQVSVDGRSYVLQELGSGLSQFIVVLANAAVRRPTFILIDEPEANLHASLQLDFLTTLASYTSGGLVVATHSYGLARTGSDRIYSITTHGSSRHVKPVEETDKLSELLGELGFASYKELGFEKVLLVEGATELRTIQQVLRHYSKDHEVLLLPLGGSTLIHADVDAELEEIKRITPKVFAMIDSEKQSANAPLSTPRQGFVDACKRAGISCHVLKRRALENYFTEAAIKSVLQGPRRALAEYEALSALRGQAWEKSSNWRIARAMRPVDWSSTDVGRFLERI